MEHRHASRFPSAICVLVALSLQPAIDPAMADIQKWLIMPGPVVNSHADIESDCSSCHSPIAKKPQGELCLNCHTATRDDIANDAGFHGRLPAAQQPACANCHTEHEGREMDITGLDAGTFDHTRTDFPLMGAHANVRCDGCHAAGVAHREAPSACIACHRQEDVHDGNLGTDCAGCHTTRNWSATAFDHGDTGFPLSGAHSAVACSTCHEGSQFAAAGQTCIACHRSDDLHRGQNGPQCADCHGVSSWRGVAFDHEAVSGFALTGGHKSLGCQACHRGGNTSPADGRTCAACHERDDPHAGRFGTTCESCHSVNDWRSVRFDHAKKTTFTLPPGHDKLPCNTCHTGNLADALPRDCGTCHADEDPHGKQLGNVCESCHMPTSWTAELWFDHDITSFPLLGAHAALSCDQCHVTAAFHDAGSTCVACHAGGDPHNGGLGQQCENCHNPSAWRASRFDHDRTDFPLTGAHTALSCNACHLDDTKPTHTAGSNCVSCHRRDDPHLGRFGDDCSNCHTTSTFSRIEGM